MEDYPMSRVTPKKMENYSVVKAKWRHPTCIKCFKDIVKDCKNKEITLPTLADASFYCSFKYLHLAFACKHYMSKIKGQTPVLSFYDGIGKNAKT